VRPSRTSPLNHAARYIQAAALGIFLSLVGNAVQAAGLVRLAAIEREPYAGPDLPDQGYVPELIRVAFSRSGYQVEIAFYPPGRARSLAQSGDVDGWMPVYADPALSDDFILSAPFPGDHLGLLKRSDSAIHLGKDAARDPAAALEALSRYRFGATRSTLPASAAEATGRLRREMVTLDLQNLDKLAYGRIDVAIIDKYVAADLMATRRPYFIGKLEFLTPALFSSSFHLAFPLGQPRHVELRQAFNDGLKTLEKDGSLARILARHGLAAPAPPKSGRTRLTIGTVNNREMQVMQRLSRKFEQAHPDIGLDWHVLEENILRRRTLSDLSIADGQFDVVTIGPNEAQSWRQGWLLPIDKLPTDYELDDILPTVRSSLSVNGQLYALPFYAESSMTYYRRDLFQQAGLVMPARPTVDQIRRFAQALHRPERQQYGICLRGKPGWGENMALISTLINTFGGRWFTPRWEPEIDSPEWFGAVNWYVDVLRSYGPPDAARTGFNENLQLFADGHCAMWIDATVAAGSLFNPKESKVAASLGFAAAPTAVTPKGSHWLWTWALAIPASTENREAARLFISWATSKDYIRLVAAEEGWVAVPPGTRRSTYDSPGYKAAAPFAGFVLDALTRADPRNPTLKPVPYVGIQVVAIQEYPAIGNIVGHEISEALTGKQNVRQALERAQKQTRKLMRESGYLP
jgi:sorbitol/mannitol transport system substrate-binding protein